MGDIAWEFGVFHYQGDGNVIWVQNGVLKVSRSFVSFHKAMRRSSDAQVC